MMSILVHGKVLHRGIVPTVGHHFPCVRIPDDYGSLFTTRSNKLVLSRVDEWKYGLLMQIEGLVLILKVNVMQMNQCVSSWRDNRLQIRVVLDLGDLWVVHYNLILSDTKLMLTVTLIFVNFHASFSCTTSSSFLGVWSRFNFSLGTWNRGISSLKCSSSFLSDFFFLSCELDFLLLEALLDMSEECFLNFLLMTGQNVHSVGLIRAKVLLRFLQVRCSHSIRARMPSVFIKIIYGYDANWISDEKSLILSIRVLLGPSVVLHTSWHS